MSAARSLAARGPWAWLLVALLAWVAGAVPGAAEEYRIGSGDVVRIVVWGQDNLSGDYQVDAQGFVPFPLLGRVNARSLTSLELTARLTELLKKDYLVDPQVMVTVKEYLSQKVQVLGETEKPGLFYLTGPTTITEIVARAGGLTKAAGRYLLLVRPSRDGQPGMPAGSVTRRLDIERLRAGDAAENELLEDGDRVVVPRAQMVFFVQGEVVRSGAFPLDRETTVLDAVTIAGGLTDKAAASNVRLIRRKADGTQETLPVSLAGSASDGTLKLEDGDTVVVPRGNAYFVFGEIKKPGAYQLDRSMNILEAIVIAGGFTDKAAPGRTRIIRSGPAGQQTITVDMNDIIKRGQREKAILLQENDVVVVPESFF
jgi:polysaccharide export outer membrane protein